LPRSSRLISISPFRLERGHSHLPAHGDQATHMPFQGTHLPVFWIKDGASLDGFLHEGLTHEHYVDLRDRALAQRQFDTANSDMEVLYQFWCHFLVRNFNAGMYQEFQNTAVEDLRNGATNGIKYLSEYYEALLAGHAPLTDNLANDIVSLAQIEVDESRPIFQKLRAAWRNGAFDLKSRKRVDTLLSPDLRAELEK